MSILIHEQAGRRTIFYPDDRHLRQYAVSCPTLISIEIWRDAAWPRTRFVTGWSLGKMTRTHLKPRSFSSRSQGNRTEDY
jgi:hypothetical protein